MEKRAGQTQDKLWIFDLIVLKLRKYGADEKTIDLISDCLSDRHHCVKLGHTFSFFSFLSFGLRSLSPYNCEVSRKIHSFLAECQSDHISKQIFYVVMLNILQLLGVLGSLTIIFLFYIADPADPRDPDPPYM